MLTGGLARIVSVPLKQVNPDGGPPFKTKRGKEGVFSAQIQSHTALLTFEKRPATHREFCVLLLLLP